MLSIYKIAHNSKIYGPGNRDVVWFTGCSFHCKNCVNPELWDNKLGKQYSLDEFVSEIRSREITLLGGEPLQQKDIKSLVNKLKEKDVGIILFTGYEIEEIPESLKSTVEKCDVVIYGRYIDELKDDSLYLIGSKNQKIIMNTSRYSKNDFDKPNSFEMLIGDDVEIHGRTKTLVNDLFDIK